MKQIDKILLAELKPKWVVFLVIILLVFFMVALETINPWSFKIIIDNVLGSTPVEEKGFMAYLMRLFASKQSLGFFAILIYFCSSLLSTVTEYFIGIIRKKLIRTVISSFSKKAFANLEKLYIGFYKNQEIGDYIYRLSYDVNALGELLEAGLIPLLHNFLYLTATISIIIWISPTLSILALGLLPILALSLGIFYKEIDTSSKQSERSNSALFSFIEEVLGQLKIIQAYNQEKKESGKFSEKEDTALTNELTMYGLGFVMNLCIGIVIAMGYALIIFYGMQQVFAGKLSTGLLIVFILYLDNLSNPLLSFVTALTTIKETHVKISRMNDFFTTQFHAKDIGNSITIPTGDIVFKNVSVKTQQGSHIIKNISVTIPGGKRTVVVGVNGSGKTTIASLLLRFLYPTSGSITIGGRPLERFSIQSLRSHMAYVPQEIVLFNDTIKNNIAFGKPKATQKEIKKALNLTDATAFIKRLPGGLNFHVGEAGNNLSGGQRQRVMLTRAFLNDQAHIYILDEPLSALDVQTRDKIMDSITQITKQKTVIIISNVLEIINQADFVVVIHQGQLLHTGTPESLLKHNTLNTLILKSTNAL